MKEKDINLSRYNDLKHDIKKNTDLIELLRKNTIHLINQIKLKQELESRILEMKSILEQVDYDKPVQELKQEQIYIVVGWNGAFISGYYSSKEEALNSNHQNEEHMIRELYLIK